MSAVRVAAPLWQLTKRDPSTAFIALARTFLVVVHSTLTGPLSGGYLGGDFLGPTNAVPR